MSYAVTTSTSGLAVTKSTLRGRLGTMVAICLWVGLVGCGATPKQTSKSTRRPLPAPELASREAQQATKFAAYGAQAGPGEQSAIIDMLHRYSSAMSAGEFAHACGLLSRAARAAIDRAQSMNGKTVGSACGARLGAAVAAAIGVPNDHVDFASVRASGVRLKGDAGYVVFTAAGTGRELEVLSMTHEAGSWRIAAPIAIPIIYAAPAAVAG